MRGERNPMQVGMIYVVTSSKQNHHKDARLREGDVLICLEHTGDCHYTWVLLKETSGNSEMRYFNIDKVYSDYVVGAKPMITKPLDDAQMLKCLAAFHLNGRAAMLINRNSAEKEKRSGANCPVCGGVIKPKVSKDNLNWPTEIS